MKAETTLEMRFGVSGETVVVDQAALTEAVTDFLEEYGTESFLGAEFIEIVNHGGGGEKFERLLAACGMDAPEFFALVLGQLEEANHKAEKAISVGGIVLPKRLLLPILEVVLPGSGFISVKSVTQYEHLTNTRVPDEERGDLQEVLDKYPVRLSRHVIRQSRLSPMVAYQFMPFVEELDQAGLQNTWIGQFHQGLLEQMYQNRPIFVLHMSCPVYCRFCFRKHKDCRNLPTPTTEDVGKALQYIRGAKDIKEIVLTGGEPLMNRETLTYAVEELGKIDHIQTIRIASRCISYYPQMFYKDDRFWLDYLIGKNQELAARGKRIEVATHFIHPDEVSHYSLDIITTLARNGVPVYTQTPFLKGCNDTGVELTDLYSTLRGAGSEMHYIYIPCSPIQGNSIYWTDIATGHKVAKYLRGHLSDRAMPIICTATKIGKIDWNASGWAVEQDGDDPDNIWIRTPYSEDYFKQFAPNFTLMSTRANKNSTLDAPFMAKIGDEKLFLGHLEEPGGSEPLFEPERLAKAREFVRADERVMQSIVPTGVESLWRIHPTRVELDAGREEDLDAQLAYIREHRAVTDVVASAEKGLVDKIDALEKLAKGLRGIPHVNALRLRLADFTYDPEVLSSELIDRISAMNALDPGEPLRLEIESQFMHSSEFRDIHAGIISRFLSHGVTVYGNIILVTGVNDNATEMKLMCYKCRQIGIELFNLYVAGLPVQEFMNAGRPVEASDVIHIATHLRRHESGRELPLYVVRGSLGDVDFNLSGICREALEGSVTMTLTPYVEADFKAIDPDFAWPETVQVSEEGHPVVEVKGLTVTRNKKFFLRG